MPQKLHNPPTQRITLLRFDNPPPQLLIILPRPLQYLLPTNRKLRTTRLPNLPIPPPSLPLRTRPPPHILPHLLRHMFIRCVRFQTPGVPVAAEVHVAGLLYEGELEGTEGVDVGVQGGIGVPGGEEAGAVGVQEGEGGGEVGVIVNYVGEVGHGFVAFVEGGGEVVGDSIGGRVDGVYCCLPAEAGY